MDHGEPRISFCKQQHFQRMDVKLHIAPEIYKGERRTTRSNIYMFGMLVYEIFYHKSFTKIFTKPLFDTLGVFLEGGHPPLKRRVVVNDVLRMCWTRNPFERKTIDEIIWALSRKVTIVEEMFNLLKYEIGADIELRCVDGKIRAHSQILKARLREIPDTSQFRLSSMCDFLLFVYTGTLRKSYNEQDVLQLFGEFSKTALRIQNPTDVVLEILGQVRCLSPDIQIETTDGILDTHKIVLQCRSGMYRELLTLTNSQEIHDHNLSVSALSVLLNYFYTNEIVGTSSDLLELEDAEEYYQLRDFELNL